MLASGERAPRAGQGARQWPRRDHPARPDGRFAHVGREESFPMAAPDPLTSAQCHLIAGPWGGGGGAESL